MQKTWRMAWRGSWLLGLLLGQLVEGLFLFSFRSQVSSKKKALWFHRWATRVARCLHLHISQSGNAPSEGLLISNHLGYLDIITLAATTPCLFVSKKEVASWPLLNAIASLAGIIYIDRSRRHDVGRCIVAMENVLNDQTVLVLFPEGTSSDGKTILPLNSALLEIANRYSLTLSVLAYALEDGDPSQEVCYWGKMTLFPHLLRLLSKKNVNVSVKYMPFSEKIAERKILAHRLHAALLAMHRPSLSPLGSTPQTVTVISS